MGFRNALLGYAGRVADITDHAVERGSDISDHYRKRPQNIQIEGVVTNTPIETGFPGQTAISSVVNAVKGADPVKSAWDTINGYFVNAEIITISTSLESYPNVALTSFSVTRDVANGQNLRFSCTARQMNIISTLPDVDAIPIPERESAGKGKTGKNSKGKQPTSDASGTKSQSIGVKIFDKLAGTS
jgi:hypothetical protein